MCLVIILRWLVRGIWVKVLQSSFVQDIMVTLKKYSTDLGQQVIKPALKEFVEHAKENGVDTTHIATNKNVFQYMNDMTTIKDNLLVGYFKCQSGYVYLEMELQPKILLLRQR